jgi:hypothetical protein
MYINTSTIISFAALLTAIITILSVVIAAYKWYLKQEIQDKDIKKIKKEQTLLTYGILACLKGLQEQGCNGPVTAAVDKIEKHMNEQAHE